LTGDYLLNRAFEVLAMAPQLKSEKKIHLISLLGAASGGVGMIGGQVLDLARDKRVLRIDELKIIHMKKTGALFGLAAEMGAILANAEPLECIQMRKFGNLLGLLFQITDDILDSKETGKTTYVSLLGKEGARMEAERVYNEVVTLVSQWPELKQIAEKVLVRSS